MASDSACAAGASARGVRNVKPTANGNSPDLARIRLGRTVCRLAAVCAIGCLLTACSESHENTPPQGRSMNSQTQEVAHFDVSMLSYYERPIFDVQLNGVDIGAAGPPPHGDHAGLVVGVAVPLGPQAISWRLDGPKGMPGNGDTVQAKNQPILTVEDAKHRYLGVHVYPDNTVELVAEDDWPGNTAKGDAFLEAWERKHGQ
jgi:hypothetical protein